MSKLTTKQKKFCDEYIKSGNAKDAAIKAGYSPKTAYSIGNENLNKPELKFYIEEQMKKLESKKTAGAREVLEYLSSVMRGEQTESVTTAKGVYDDVPVSAKDRISAAKEILKRYPVDPLGKAQLRRANADARVAEAKAKAMEDNGQDIEQLLDKMLVSLDKADDRNSNN
ncbi:terminase small subunit [Lactobacillus paragasseri JV-V03]|uniref:Terminase small subunit n=1 Tax=Lactobacillus paragasseri JV-V03 TaxID=525326 RepID=A0AA86ZZY7_9LACO|nr:terminase small subunit [Lactobacillus paragasseri]EFJ69861.1 terminase small subunit [Lactobacillus paragasseri JV-V03]